MLVLTLGLSSGSAGYCATNTVTSLADTGAGSLRQVISNSASGDTIVFSASGVINLSASELFLERDLTIQGPGASVLSINGNQRSRIFEVQTNVSAWISGLTISNGLAPYPGGDGGAIYNAGKLWLRDCVFSSNRTPDGADGSGGYDYGASGGSGGDGGAIWNSGSLWAERCLFSDNKAGRGGSGNSGRVGGGSGGNGGAGGAIHSPGELRLTSCTFSYNECGSGGGGGGGQATGGSPGFGGSGGAISANNAVLVGCSAISNYSGFGGSGGAAMTGANGGGGGLGGGVAVWGTLLLTNCTVAGNMTGGGGPAAYWSFGSVRGGEGGEGGGIFCVGGAIVACTIVNNGTGLGGMGSGASGSNGRGGGVRAEGTLVLNSLLALNSGVGSNLFGTFNSLGHNLVGTTNGGSGFGALGDLAGSDAAPIDPRVGLLADYGGPTPTVPLLADSPALENGAGSGILPTDQRGIFRPQGVRADIGAYEFQFTVPRIINWQASSGFWLQGCALPQTKCVVQFSTNLLDWSDLADFLTGPDGVGEFTDSSGIGGSEQRFYRLKRASPQPAVQPTGAVSL